MGQDFKRKKYETLIKWGGGRQVWPSSDTVKRKKDGVKKEKKMKKKKGRHFFFGLIKVRLKSRCVSTVYSKMAVEGTGGR